jgi:hypothetical protein
VTARVGFRGYGAFSVFDVCTTYCMMDILHTRCHETGSLESLRKWLVALIRAFSNETRRAASVPRTTTFRPLSPFTISKDHLGDPNLRSSSMAPIRTEEKASRPRERQTTLTGKPAGSPSKAGTTSKAAKRKSNGAVNPDWVETDVLLCIRPEFVQLIGQKKKNHEYRRYKLRDGVKRLWFYETKPVSSVT